MTLNQRFMSRHVTGLLSVLFAVMMVLGEMFVYAAPVQGAHRQVPPSAEQSSRIPPDQLDSLVAPIALYPDQLLAQTLAASTYPLELLQLHQWLARNPGLKDKALLDAVARQPWDPSIQAMAAVPDVVKRLADDIQWTTDLGNAFLAQEADVMDAVQRMRRTAQDKGSLQSTAQQTVETQVVERESVIVIEQADPEVLYVPSYNPTVVWGAPIYPYPPIYYPPAGYYAAGAALSFGAGVAMGAFWSGGWGWGANWGDADISINRNNYFNRNTSINAGNRWQHRPEHRGGAPYRDRATADRFGGTARGDSLAARQAGARQQISREGGNLRSGAVGTSGAGSRATGSGLSDRTGTGSRRPSGAGISGREGSGSLSSRAGSGGSDHIGSRDLSRGGGRSESAFSGASDGFSGSSARSSSSRGSSSMRSSRSSGGFSGGGSRGGGGRSRGGGGRR
jgi:hypothetical protein